VVVEQANQRPSSRPAEGDRDADPGADQPSQRPSSWHATDGTESEAVAGANLQSRGSQESLASEHTRFCIDTKVIGSTEQPEEQTAAKNVRKQDGNAVTNWGSTNFRHCISGIPVQDVPLPAEHSRQTPRSACTLLSNEGSQTGRDSATRVLLPEELLPLVQGKEPKLSHAGVAQPGQPAKPLRPVRAAQVILSAMVHPPKNYYSVINHIKYRKNKLYFKL
jgi:hypothetical protein